MAGETTGGEAVLGFELAALADDQRRWSSETFGGGEVRGPVGTLKHLAREAVEVQAAWVRWKEMATDAPAEDRLNAARDVREELGDCLILLLDAGWRAGLSPLDLITAARAKMVKNRQRSWPSLADQNPDEPCEHDRSGE